MADQTITELTAIAAVAGEDVIVIVDDPAGSPATRKATITQLQTFLAAGLQSTQQFTASSTWARPAGINSILVFGIRERKEIVYKN